MVMQQSTGVLVPNVTGAYAARDAVGDRFEIPYAAGERGAWLGTLIFAELYSARGDLRLHLFGDEFASASDNATWEMSANDFPNYLGYVDFDTWVTASGAMNIAQATNPGIAIYASAGQRHIYGQCQTINGYTANGDTGLSLNMRNVGDQR